MNDELRRGDRVEWNTSQGRTEGTVERKLTSPTHVKGHRVAASPDEPQYLVRSAKSGAEAAHKPESLRRVSSREQIEAEHREILDDFHSAVNMTAGELERWLRTEESRSVGQKEETGSESVGHASGRRIVKLLRTRKADYTDGDYRHMRKVVGYVHRHLAQWPDGDVTHTRWRYSLMNWGHDPLE